MGDKTKLPRLRAENLVVKELANEILIYDLDNNKAFCLNETARLILDECDGTKSIDDALKSVNRRLKADLNEELVWLMIEQFKQSNFIAGNYDLPVQTTKISRRKILQTAALMGVALPLVTSLVAPISTHAASCAQTNQPCSNTPGGGSTCCQPLTCINTESGPTGFSCVGIVCIPENQPCTIVGTICCNVGVCTESAGGNICIVIG